MPDEQPMYATPEQQDRTRWLIYAMNKWPDLSIEEQMSAADYCREGRVTWSDRGEEADFEPTPLPGLEVVPCL